MKFPAYQKDILLLDRVRRITTGANVHRINSLIQLYLFDIETLNLATNKKDYAKHLKRVKDTEHQLLLQIECEACD